MVHLDTELQCAVAYAEEGQTCSHPGERRSTAQTDPWLGEGVLESPPLTQGLCNEGDLEGPPRDCSDASLPVLLILTYSSVPLTP